MRRRSFLTLCGLAGASAAVPRVLLAQETDNSGITGTGEVVVAALGGSLQVNQRAAYFEPFQKISGITVRLISYNNLSQALAQHRTGNVEWDIIYMSGGGMLSLAEKGALEKIDYDMLDPTERNAIRKSFQKTYGAPDVVFTRTLGYNTSAFPSGVYPKSWNDVWNVAKFPGPRSLAGFSGTLSPDLEFALLADGVPKDELYPLDVDRAFKSLDRIRPNITTFWTTGAMAPQALASGNVVIASAYTTRVFHLKSTGAPVDFTWNGGVMYMGYWGILKGAKNYKNAMKCISYITRGKSQARLATLVPMGPSNSNAFKYMSADQQALLPTSPQNVGKQFLYNIEWWAKHRQAIQERWNKWLISG